MPVRLLTHPISRSVIFRSPVSVGKRTVGRNYIASRRNCQAQWVFGAFEHFRLKAARPVSAPSPTLFAPFRTAPARIEGTGRTHTRATSELLLRRQPPHAAGIGLPGWNSGVVVPTTTHHGPGLPVACRTGPQFRTDPSGAGGLTASSRREKSERSRDSPTALHPSRPASGPAAPAGGGSAMALRGHAGRPGRTTGGLRPGPPPAAARPLPGASGQGTPLTALRGRLPISGEVGRERELGPHACIDRVGREVP